MLKEKYTIAYGNPFDGITLIGLYDTHDEAVEAADVDNPADEWHIVEITLQKE